MMSKPDFEDSQVNLIRDDLNKTQKTIVIDIQGTMVTRVTDEVKQSNREYVIADNKVYKINPEAYNFILAVSPFFELICFSNLPEKTLLTIIDHIEGI